MAVNCNAKYWLGCVDVCEVNFQFPTGGEAPSTGTYSAVFEYLGRSIIIQFEATLGELIVIPVSGLNERFTFCFHILDENDDRVELTIGGTLYDCFKLQTKPTAVGETIPLKLFLLACAALTDPTNGLNDEQKNECLLPLYDFSDLVVQSNVTPQQQADLIAWLGGGGCLDAVFNFRSWDDVVTLLSNVASGATYEHYRIIVTNSTGTQIEVDRGLEPDLFTDLRGLHALDTSTPGELRLPKVLVQYTDAAGVEQFILNEVFEWYSTGFGEPAEKHQRAGFAFSRIEIRKSDSSVIAYVDILTASYNVADSRVSNSDDSYDVNVKATEELELPDINISNSAGVIGTSPAAKDILIGNSTVRNSNSSYLVLVPATVELVIPDITIDNSAETLGLVVPAAIGVVLADIEIKNNADSLTLYVDTAGVNLNLPLVRVQYRNASDVLTALENSDFTYSAPYLYLDLSVEIERIEITKTGGANIGFADIATPSRSAPSFVVPDSDIESSGGTFSDTVEADSLYLIADVKVKINGVDYENLEYAPQSAGFVLDVSGIGATPSGILYQFGNLLTMGERTSYGAGSEGNLLSSGWFDYDGPSYPIHRAKLDSSHATPWLNLVDNNSFGNVNRFTDDLGGQTYANDLVIDHLTGLQWYRIATSAAAWATLLSNVQASSQGGFTDWEVPTEKTLESIVDYELGTGSLNYAPINIGAVNLWTSTTAPTATTNARRFIGASGNTGNSAKTNSYGTLMVRKIYV
jgi:hypothetical protein